MPPVTRDGARETLQVRGLDASRMKKDVTDGGDTATRYFSLSTSYESNGRKVSDGGHVWLDELVFEVG